MEILTYTLGTDPDSQEHYAEYTIKTVHGELTVRLSFGRFVDNIAPRAVTDSIVLHYADQLVKAKTARLN